VGRERFLVVEPLRLVRAPANIKIGRECQTSGIESVEPSNAMRLDAVPRSAARRASSYEAMEAGVRSRAVRGSSYGSGSRGIRLMRAAP